MYWRVVSVGCSTGRAAMPGATMVIGVRFAPGLWFVISRSIWLGCRVGPVPAAGVARDVPPPVGFQRARLRRYATGGRLPALGLLRFRAACMWQRCGCVAEIELIPHDGGDTCADDGADPIDPPVIKGALDDRGSEPAGRIHRRAG